MDEIKKGGKMEKKEKKGESARCGFIDEILFNDCFRKALIKTIVESGEELKKLKIKENDVPYEELNPYKRMKQARIDNFMVYRINESDDRESRFETLPESAKKREKNADSTK